MLCETLELYSSSRYNVLDVPWCNIVILTIVHVVQQIVISHGQSSSTSQCVSLINMRKIALKQKIFHQGLGIGQALQHTVHKTSVPKVLKTAFPGAG